MGRLWPFVEAAWVLGGRLPLLDPPLDRLDHLAVAPVVAGPSSSSGCPDSAIAARRSTGTPLSPVMVEQFVLGDPMDPSHRRLDVLAFFELGDCGTKGLLSEFLGDSH
jgi:hypothetical protein